MLDSAYSLHSNKYSLGLHYYPFAVNWDRFIGSFNTLHDLSNTVCVPDKTRFKLECF